MPKKIVFSILVLLVFVFVLEGGLRLVKPFDFDPTMFAHDPELGESYKKPWDGYFRGQRVRISEEGARIPTRYNYNNKKTDPTWVFIGDSFTFGDESPAEDSFPEIFYQLQQQQNKPVKILNFGVCGYGPTKYSIVAKRKLETIKPEALVVAFYVGNDFEEKSFSFHKNALINNIIGFVRNNTFIFKCGLDLYYGGKQSFTLVWIKRKLKTDQCFARHNKTEKISEEAMLQFLDRIYNPVKETIETRSQGWINFVSAVEDIRKNCKKNDSKLIWVIIPKNIDPSVIGKECPTLNYRQVRERLTFLNSIQEALGKPAEPVVNVLQVFAENSLTVKDLDENGKGHFGRKKNLLIARNLQKIYDQNLPESKR